MAAEETTPEAPSTSTQLTRRTALGALGGLAVGAGAAVALPHRTPDRSPAAASIPFDGEHQPGIATPPQAHVYVLILDLSTDTVNDLAKLLRVWSHAARRLMLGATATPPGPSHAPPTDPGEAAGLPPARLTLTFGLGPTLFERQGQDRMGLRHRMPAALRPLPPFRGEALEDERSGGDLCIQACADDPQVAFHAAHSLARAAAGVAVPRWSQQGFRETTSPDRTHRNLFGFKEGTRNIKSDNTNALRQHVWARETGPHKWMRNGSYLVVRQIRMLFDVWDLTTLDGQERAIGRHKHSGAPLTRKSDADPLDLDRSSATGEPAIPANAHVRLAAPQTNHGARLLRRSYSTTNGIEPGTGQLNAGLLFLCYQRDPQRQFVPIQHRLAANDALNKHILHTGSALFACPPGASRNGYIGKQLFERE